MIINPNLDFRKNPLGFLYSTDHFVLNLFWLTSSVKIQRICHPAMFQVLKTKAQIKKINFKINLKMLKDLICQKKLEDPYLATLKGRQVYLHSPGLSLDEIELQKLIINLLGGFYFHQFHPGLTDMVILQKPTALLAESVKDVYTEVDFINTDYLKDCLLYKRAIPFEEYTFHDKKQLFSHQTLLTKRDRFSENSKNFSMSQRLSYHSQRDSQITGIGQPFFTQKFPGSTCNENFNEPLQNLPRDSGYELKTNNCSNNLSNSKANNTSNIMKEINDHLGNRSTNNSSICNRFKSLKETSQNSFTDVPFKSFLFEKCLFYFFEKNMNAFDFKKKVLEHSGSIVKNYASLQSKQLIGRDFFIILKDGFDDKKVTT